MLSPEIYFCERQQQPRCFAERKMMNISELKFAHRFDNVTGSAIREIFKVINVPGMISFAGGNPSPAALPDTECAELAKELLLKNGKTLLQYGATEGYAPLKESLPGYIRDRFGFDVTPSGVLPTTGSTQGMDLLCKALIDPGDKIVIENPTFLGNMQCMHLYDAKLIPAPGDDIGVDTDALEEVFRKEHPKMMYVIPTFQNPTGRTLPVERRKKIAELAAQYGVIIAEDDPYRDLRYTGEELPSIRSFDKEGWVVFLGSFSKVISPGLRVGFLCAPPDLLRKCTIGKQSSDVHTSLLSQAIVDAYLRQGLLMPHVKEICKSYSLQCSTMLSLLENCAGIKSFTRPDGGLFIWVELREDLNAVELLKNAIDSLVAYVPGTHFFEGGGHLNTLRLNFSMSTVDSIRTGMEKLNTVFTKACNK